MAYLMRGKSLVTALSWTALFLFIVTTVIGVTVNAYPLYQWESQRLGLAQDLGLTQGELLHNYRQMMGYLNNPFQQTFHLTDFAHSEAGAFHFYEVKKLFQLNYIVWLVTLFPSVLFIKGLKETGGLWRLVRPFQVGMIVPLVIGFIIATAFDWFFVAFHQLFFNNDAWLFDPATDPIINALPESFFMICFIFGFLLLEIIFVIGCAIGKRSN